MSNEVALLVALLLLAGNALFVAAEFSLVSVRRSAIEPKAVSGSKSAKQTLRALENVALLMAGAQLGITLCSLGLGAVAEPTLAHLLQGPFEHLHVTAELVHPAAFVIALGITVFLHVVIGEMVPKNIALVKPERSALFLTPWLVSIVRVLNPVVYLLNLLANQSLKAIGVKPKSEVSSTYTRDEMADLVEESRKEGLLDEENEQLLAGALSFDERTVRDIAIPARQMITINPSARYTDIEALAVETGFSRFPVCKRRGQVTGYVHLKDIITIEDTKQDDKIKPSQIRQLAKVSASQSIRMTLKIMQRSGTHIALVTNGKTIVGMVTLDDVLEELVGEIREQQSHTVITEFDRSAS